MQYLLNEEEMRQYQELIRQVQKIPSYDHTVDNVENLRSYMSEVNETCSDIVHTFVPPESNRALGCPHLSSRRYCDKCPVETICGLRKSWSK
jgi:hypothetical protein